MITPEIYHKYTALGFSCIPCKDKYPHIKPNSPNEDDRKWGRFQTYIPTESDIQSFSGNQVGLVCGKVSGGLFCIDFDVKNGDRFEEWQTIVNSMLPEVLSKVVIESTPSGGYHVIFKTDLCSIGNKKLAVNSGGKDVMIESRGEGGYFVCTPSPNYTWYYNTIEDVQHITDEQTICLLDAARALDERPKQEYVPKAKPIASSAGLTPFDDYDQRADAVSLLVQHGWKVAFSRNGAIYLTRPGKDRGISATWNRIPDRLYCFTTSTVFENEKVYKASAVYAMLEHGGDYSAAAKKLYAEGYGDRVTKDNPIYSTDHCNILELKEVDLKAKNVDTTQPIVNTLWKISQKKGYSVTEKNREASKTVVMWLWSKGKIYKTRQNEFSGIMFFDNEKKILFPVQSDAFIGWLSDIVAVNRGEKLFEFILSEIENEGIVRGKEVETSVYWASSKDSFYLSCGYGSMAKMHNGTVEIVDNGVDGILFKPTDCLPKWELTTPKNPFETCKIFSDLSTNENSKNLLLLWIISLVTNQKTKPPICTTGTVGSGKTRVIRGIFELYGMNERISNIKERDGIGDFWTTVNNGGLVCFDNCDTRNTWFPDALAGASTAGTHEKRQLYSDSVNISLKSNAWIAVTSANPTFGSDSGLSDRLLIVRLNRRTGNTDEVKLSAEVAMNRNSSLSFICETLSKTLIDNEPVQGGLNSRHPDFAEMAIKIGRAMGKEDSAIASLQAAEKDKSIFCLENNPIGSAILEYCKNQSFEGTTNDLKTELVKIDSSIEKKYSPIKIGKMIKSMWPHLEKCVSAKKGEKNRDKVNVYTFAGSAGS